MRTRAWAVVCCVAAVVALCSMGSGQDSPARRAQPPDLSPFSPSPPPEATARCLVKVTSDAVPVNDAGFQRVLAELVHASSVWGRAVKDAELKASDCRLDPSFLRASGRDLLIGLQVGVQGGNEASAQRLLLRVVERLEGALTEWGEQEKAAAVERRDQLGTAVMDAERRLNALRAQETELVLALAKVPQGDPQKALRDLAASKVSLEMQFRADEAEMKVLEERLAGIVAEAAKTVKDDELSAELAKIAALQQAEVEGLKKHQEAGRATQAELDKAREALYRTKAELIRRREELAKAAGAEEVATIRRRLVELSAHRARRQTEMEALAEQLALVSDPKVLKNVQELKRVSLETQLAEREYARARQEHLSFAEMVRPGKPITMTVIGAQEKAASSPGSVRETREARTVD